MGWGLRFLKLKSCQAAFLWASPEKHIHLSIFKCWGDFLSYNLLIPSMLSQIIQRSTKGQWSFNPTSTLVSSLKEYFNMNEQIILFWYKYNFKPLSSFTLLNLFRWYLTRYFYLALAINGNKMHSSKYFFSIPSGVKNQSKHILTLVSGLYSCCLCGFCWSVVLQQIEIIYPHM